MTLSVKKRLFKRLEEWQAVISPKLKIVWSMLQMLTLLGICFGVQWPAQYEEVVRAVEEGVNLNFLKLVTVSCWQEWTWHHTLLLRTVAPSALYLLCMGFVALAWLAKAVQALPRRHARDARPRAHRHDHLPRVPGRRRR